MRHMINNVDAAIVPWDAATSRGNGWRVCKEVYPSAIAVRHVSGPEVFKRDDRSGAFAEVERWEVAHVGVYSVVTIRNGDGERCHTLDHLAPAPPIDLALEDVGCALYAAVPDNQRLARSAVEEARGVLADTARCIIAGWWVMTSTHEQLGKHPHFEALMRTCNWRNGHRLPFGIGERNRDLTAPFPLIID